ncbi:MAG: hypothetical protein IKD69_03635 [Solobacterium sp.]|nr:hypothetical protein [Solobacterium sp.]
MRKNPNDVINAANEAMYHLTRAQDLLKSARGWGVADLIGGGIVISAIKRKKMQDAADAIQDAMPYLRIVDEFAHHEFSQYDLESFGLAGLIDIIGDNVFSDVFAQDRIKRTLVTVENCIDSLDGVLDALSDMAMNQQY